MQNQQGVVLATAGYDHGIRFWDCTTGACTKTIKVPESQINALAVSSDKHFVAAACNPSVKIFDLTRVGGNPQDSSPIVSLDGHTGNVTNVGFDADNKWVYSGGEDGTVRIWDPRASTKCQRVFLSETPGLSSSHLGGLSATANKMQTAPHTTTTAGGAMASEKNNWSEARKNCVNCVALHANQVELVCGDAGGRVKIYDLTGKESEPSVSIHSPDDGAVRSVAISDERVFFATDSGTVHWWEPEDPNNLQIGSVDLGPGTRCHNSYILKIAVSPDYKLLATASADHTAKIFRTKDMTQLKVLAKHQRWVWDLSFSADSSFLVTSSSDTTTRLWDVNTGESVRNFLGHQKSVVAVCLNDASH